VEEVLLGDSLRIIVGVDGGLDELAGDPGDV